MARVFSQITLRTAALAALLLASIGVSGCSSSSVTDPTAKFSQAVSQSAGTVEAEFTGEFAYWQNNYLQIQAIHSEPIDGPYFEGLQQRDGKPRISFSNEAIVARVKVIDGIKSYAEALGKLAGSTAPSDLVANGKTLSDNLNSLAKTAAPNDATFSKYSGPLTDIATWVGQQYMTGQRDAAIAAAVTKAAPGFQKILAQLKVDLELLRDDKVAMASKLSAERIHQFNQPAAKNPGEQALLTIGGEVLAADAARQSLQSYSALDAIDAWSKAHAAIVIYLQSPKKSDDLASLSAEIDAFSSRIQPLAQAIGDLKK